MKTILAVLVLACVATVAVGQSRTQLDIVGQAGYLPPTYVLPVPPAVRITRGANAIGLDLISDETIGGEYSMRWRLASGITSGYINNGGHVNVCTSLTVSGTTSNQGSDINMRVIPPSGDPFMLGVWSDVPGPAVISRTNSLGGPPFVAADRDGVYTTRIEEYGTISLKPQVTDAATLSGYGRVFAKDDGLYWRAPSGAVRRLDVE